MIRGSSVHMADGEQVVFVPPPELHQLLTAVFNKLNGKEITVNGVSKYRKDLDEPSFFPLQEKEREQAKITVDKNRQQIFNIYRGKFDELGIEDYNKINSHTVVKIEKYTEFQKILEEEKPAIFLYQPIYSYMIDKNIKGINISNINKPADRFSNVTNWYIKTRKEFSWK